MADKDTLYGYKCCAWTPTNSSVQPAGLNLVTRVQPRVSIMTIKTKHPVYGNGSDAEPVSLDISENSGNRLSIEDNGLYVAPNKYFKVGGYHEDGDEAQVGGEDSAGVAIGSGASAIPLDSIATGYAAKAQEQASTVYGSKAVSSAKGAIAVGFASTASGKYSIALGSGSVASAEHAVAIGPQSVAKSEKEVSFGNETLKRRLANVANGETYNDATNVYQTAYYVYEALRWLHAQGDAKDHPIVGINDKGLITFSSRADGEIYPTFDGKSPPPDNIPGEEDNA